MDPNNDHQPQGQSILQRRRTVESELHTLEAESLAESLPEGFNSSSGISHTKYINNLVIVLNIVNGSVWGVLVRRGLNSLTSYHGTYLGGVVWANFTACFVMSLAIDSSKLWCRLLEDANDRTDKLPETLKYPNKGAIPLYVGITTGFCGTCSSFSSVILEAFNKAADTEPGVAYLYPNGAYGIMEFLAVIATHIGMSVAGFHLGKHVCELGDRYSPSFSKRVYKTLESLSMFIGIISIVITCILIGVKKSGSWRSWTFSIFFAPFGALLRFYLSKYLNSKLLNFPLGTFTANMVGTVLLAVFTILGRGRLSHGTRIVSGPLACHVLTGLDDGFCGALTTISTFIVELFALKVAYSYRYGIISILASFALLVVSLGSYAWTRGLAEPVCS